MSISVELMNQNRKLIKNVERGKVIGILKELSGKEGVLGKGFLR